MKAIFSKNNINTSLTAGVWTPLAIIIAVILSIPLISIFSSVFTNSFDVWIHLAQTVLMDYMVNSLWLMVGVGAGVLIIGVVTAWLVTFCRFWGARLFEWALLLPLAAPAYLLGYTYTNMLDYFGPVQTLLRQIFGWQSSQDYWFPSIRSLPGCILMLMLVLYPYVYLLARVAFLEQSQCTLEASRSLGCNPWRSFFSVALPLARPAIMAGLALALMETLNDFGTVQYFGVNSFTTGIYNTWFGMGDRIAAAQLSTVLMIFILALIIIEKFSRRGARYYDTSNRRQPLSKYELKGLRGLGALISCFLPIFFGFILPGSYLLYLGIYQARQTGDNDFIGLAANSLILAGLTAAIALVVSLFLAYGERLSPNILLRSAVRFASIGYAIPGVVIAVGVLIPLGYFDKWLDETFKIILSGTLAVLIFAYLVRFLTVSVGTLESSLEKIKPSLDDASHSLGHGVTSTLFNIHIPLMSGGILTAVMLVFVDVMKELPATLVLRPFNFDTLAVRVYQYASDERLVEAALPALAIVATGILPVIVLSWQIARSREYS